MYWVYVLQDDVGKWYIGYTSSLKRRIREYQQGIGSKTTSRMINPRCIYREGYLCRKDALSREKFLKGGSGYTYLKKQMRHFLS